MSDLLDILIDFESIGFNKYPLFKINGGNLFTKSLSLLKIWFLGKSLIVQDKLSYNKSGKYYRNLGNGKLIVFIINRFNKNGEGNLYTKPFNSDPKRDFYIIYETEDKDPQLVISGVMFETPKSLVLESIREFRFKTLMDR